MTPVFSPLKPWLDRHTGLPAFLRDEAFAPDFNHPAFIGLDVVTEVHAAGGLRAQNLAASWHATHDYLEKAFELVNGGDWISLDREEAAWIQEEFGPPPPACYPIYFISVGWPDQERVVYVGKTSASRGRFRGGHHAFTALHHPRYDGLAKRIYLATIVLMTDDIYVQLEWVRPLPYALKLLSSIEAQLIFNIKPELNVAHTRKDATIYPANVFIENHTGSSRLLDGHAYSPNPALLDPSG